MDRIDLDDDGRECPVYSESDRYTIYDCDDHLRGEVKHIDKGLKNGTFAVRHGSGSRDTKKLLKYLGKMDNYVDDGDKVYIKTSFSFISDSPNHDILDRVIKEARKSGAEEVSIVDNDTPNRKFTNDLIVKSGYYEIVKEKEVPIYNMNNSEKIKFRGGDTEFTLPKVLFDENAKLINIAPMRHDLRSGVNLGMKNLVDLVDPVDVHNNDMTKLITSVTAALDPDLTILDGSRACLSGYPVLCKDYDGDFLLASNDPVCADAWGSKILFYPSGKVKHITEAEKQGIGKTNCMEAKKSLNPITVAKSDWKKAAPTPDIVGNFSESYDTMKQLIGGKKTNDLWMKTISPALNKITN